MVTWATLAAGDDKNRRVPFIADPSPLEGQVGPWAQRQFEALQRVSAALEARVEALEAKVADLEARLAALEALVGADEWDRP